MEPAKLIHKKLKGYFRYLILDEVHEEKAADTAQANAAGSLAAACRKVIALTGTLIGGYAEHLRPLLFRLAPRTLVAEGLDWHKAMPFVERYGRIDTIIRKRDNDGGGEENSQSRGSSRSVTKVCRPGIMPTLFGRHLIGNAVFLGLEEVSAVLPRLDETVLPVALDDDLAAAYEELQGKLTDAIKEMIVKGDKRLLGTMLQTLLAYPDYPYEWDTVGYTQRAPDGSAVFIPVAEPQNLEPAIRAKEKALLDLVKREWTLGRQVWVDVTMNGERDVGTPGGDACGRRSEGLGTSLGGPTGEARSVDR
jgi:hypothetical protein